jgi:hypothetical protein
MDIKKLTLVLMLAGSAGNAFGANQCTKVGPAQLVLSAARAINYIVKNSDNNCSPTDAINAATCYQNQCASLTTNNQSYCYNHFCASTACPMTSDQFNQFAQAYSDYSEVCAINPGNIINEMCVNATTGKQVPCSNQTSSK